MASVTELVIKIAGKDEFSGVVSGVKKEASGLGKTLGDVSKIAGGFVLGQGILQAPSFFMGAAQAAADDAASVAKLQQAVVNSGGAWEQYKGTLDGVIEAAQKRGFTDDQARDALSLLTAQTGSVEEATKRFTMAQDLARGANIDVATASKLLGKVTDENVNVLGRYGIAVKEGATEAELFGAIQAKFGGQAEVFAKSTAGQMEAAKIQMGELKEKIGYAVLPVLTSVTKLVAEDLVPAISNFVDVAGPKIKAVVVPSFEALKTVFGFLASHKAETIAALTGIAAAITVAMIPAIIAWTAAEWAKVTALAAAAVAFIAANAPLVAVGLAIGAVVAGIVLLIQHWDDVTAAFKNLPGMLSDAWGQVTGFFTETVPNWIKDNWPQILIGVFTGIPGLVMFHFRDKLWEIAQTDVLPFFTSTIPNWVKDNWPQLLIGVLTGIPGLVLFHFKDALWTVFQSDVLPIFTDTIPNWLRDNWVPIVVTVLTGGAGTLIYAFRDTIANKVTEVAGNLLDSGKSLGKSIADGIADGLTGAGSALVGLGDKLIGVLKDAWNAAVDWMDQNFKISIPGPSAFGVSLPDFNWDPDLSVLRLAQGGILTGTRPRLALLHPPEAVIPLGRGPMPALQPVHHHYHTELRVDVLAGDRASMERLVSYLDNYYFRRSELT